MENFYDVPEQQFNAADSERVRKKEAGDTALKIINSWKNGLSFIS